MAELPTTWRLDLPPLDTGTVGRWILFFDALPSTQPLALERRQDGLVIVANTQTAGRGRQGRPWHSASGLGLWCSVGLDGPARGLNMAAALAIRNAVRPETRLDIKWPNDLMLEGRKIAGILTEHRNGRTALGIGINIAHQIDDFPADLRDTAASLEMLTGRTWNRAALLAGILRELDEYVSRLRRGGYTDVREEWAAALDLRGRAVRRDHVAGTVLDIDPDGALLVETAGGIVRMADGPAPSHDESQTPCCS